MKKFTYVLLALILLVALSVPVFAANGSVSIGASDNTLERGDTFTVTATLNGADAIALGTVRLVYDTNVFEMTGGSCHVSGVSIGQVIPSQNVGTFMFSGEPTVVSGKIFTFHMKVKDTAAFGNYTISSNASIGVSTGSAIASGSVSVSVVCSHSYGSWSKKDAASHQQTCSVCGDVKTENHGWDSGSVTTPATCKQPGEKTFTCATCGGTKRETIPVSDKHTYGKWTKKDDSDHSHSCSVCEKTETAAHTWNSGTVTKAATCKATGEKTFTCTGCGAAKVEVIPKRTTHTYSNSCDTTCNICGATRTISHRYQSDWSKDGSGHWHKCTVCGRKKDSAAHTPGAEATEETPQTCTVCGYVIKAALGHTHNYSEVWTTDEAGHWYACSGCEDRNSYGEHLFENACDTDCAVCGYVRTITHSYSDTWVSNEENHWHSCSVCGEKADEETHVPGPAATATTAQLCAVCKYELAAALGGEETQPTVDIIDDGGTEAAGLPWLIVGIASAVAAFAVLLFRKKK